jgi:hypothetical protein
MLLLRLHSISSCYCDQACYCYNGKLYIYNIVATLVRSTVVSRQNFLVPALPLCQHRRVVLISSKVGVLFMQELLAATMVRSLDVTVLWGIFDTIIMLDVVTTFT